MKQFLKRWWNDTGVQWLVLIFVPGFAIIWSIAWSIQDRAFNGWPFVIGAGTILAHLIFYWLFRNNP